MEAVGEYDKASIAEYSSVIAVSHLDQFHLLKQIHSVMGF